MATSYKRRKRFIVLKITHERPTSVTIRKVSDDGIYIAAAVYQHTIALTAESVIEQWPDKPIEHLRDDDFDELLATKPELIILGTGKRNLFPPRELVFALARRGIGLEFMDTAAAARTFNVLSGEGRSVAAVLYFSAQEILS